MIKTPVGSFAVFLTKLDSRFAHCVGFVEYDVSAVIGAFAPAAPWRRFPMFCNQYANGEDEIANILQLNRRCSAVDLPSIECEDRCSANFTNISVSRNSRSAGHTIAIECPLCAKTGSGPVLVGVGREDGLGPLRGTILLVLVVFSDIPWRQ